MFNQKSIIILYIDRNQFQLFGGNLSTIVTLVVPDTVIQDLDIIHKDGLYTLVKQWVKQYSLTGSQIVIVLSNFMYFEKIFSSTEHQEPETDILKFFDTVPFESIWTKVYSVEKGKRAVAVNKALYEAIHQGFLLQGLPTKAVVPAFALGPFEGRGTLDRETADYVVKNIDTLSKLSLLDAQDMGFSGTPKTDEKSISAKKSSNLPLLVGTFGILILMLVIMAVTQLR